MTTESRQITSKFSGKCLRCGGVIPSGTRCNWEPNVGVRHINCPIGTRQIDNVEQAILDSEVAANTDSPRVQRGSVSVTMGVFKKDGRIYVVKPNKDKTRVYAKEIVESPARMTENGSVADFETKYAPGVVFKLTEADRWDLADAKDFLTKFSRCIVCNRHLKAAKSVAASIGPVCAKYFAHSHACDGKPTVKLADVKAEIEDEGQPCTKCEHNCSSKYHCEQIQKANAMGPVTDDERAMLAEIKRMNDESRAWQAAGPDRWAGILTEDLYHWRLSGIRSVADLDAMQRAEDEKERRKASYDDYAQSYEHDRDHAIAR